MQAIRLGTDGSQRVMQIPVPVVSGDDVLIEVRSASLDGTDLEQIRGLHAIAAETEVTQGHEYAGRVVAVGGAATQFQPGDRVTGPFGVHCGDCPYCRDGRTNLCLHQVSLGFGRDGAWAEYLLVPERAVVPLPEPLSFDDGALLCCTVPTVLRALDRSPIEPDSRVAIFGLGQMGLTAVMAALSSHPRALIAIDPVEARRALAADWGATHTIDPRAGDLVARLQDFTGGAGADLCIVTASSLDEAGRGSVARDAFEAVARGGQVTIVGVIGEQTANFSRLISKEFRVVGSKALLGPSNVSRALDLAATGEWDLDRYRALATHRVKLDDLPRALAENRLAGAIKVLIEPPTRRSDAASNDARRDDT